jgi:hypothetical protein
MRQGGSYIADCEQRAYLSNVGQVDGPSSTG